MANIHSCTACGYTDDSASAGGEQRAITSVLDDTGSTSLCDLCLVGRLPGMCASGHLTVVVTRPVELAG